MTKTNPAAADVELALEKLEALIHRTENVLKAYDEQLKPYWYAKGDIDHEIRKTHGGQPGGLIVFRSEGAGDRVPLFAALDQLAQEWGPVKADRNAVKTRLAGYVRDAGRLTNELKYLTRKESKNAKDHGNLL